MSYFIDICMICLEHSNNLIPIKSQDANGTSFENVLKDFLLEYELELKTPKYICDKCGNNLRGDYESKQKYLRNIKTYEKYAQQVTTKDSTFKYLSVIICPNFVYEEAEIFNEHNYAKNIVELKSDIDVDTVKYEELIIKEETNKDLVLNDELASLLHDIKEEKFESDKTCYKNIQISNNSASFPIGNSTTREQDGEEQYECYICRKTCLTKVNMKSHLRLHFRKKYKYRSKNEKISGYADLKQYIRENCIEKLLKCRTCKKSYKYLKNLEKHRLIHQQRNTYICKICNKSFKQMSNLKAHYLIHTDEKPFACEFCNKKCRQMSALKSHRLIHTGEKPFVCKLCNRAFTQSQNLKSHTVVCIREQFHTCEICKKSFGLLANLKKHKLAHAAFMRKYRSQNIFMAREQKISNYTDSKQTVRGNYNEKLYDCEICCKSFKYSQVLKEHQLIHTNKTPLTCEISKKSYKNLSNLKQHELTHTDGTSYTCKVCNKSFTDLNYLKEHRSTHNGEKPFTCEFCNKSFRYMSRLKKHKLIHIGGVTAYL